MPERVVSVDNVDFYELPCLVVSQPLGDFYIASISSVALSEISHNDVRRIEEGTDNYLGIQRKLSKTRVKEIAEYVTRADAVFPTGVIVCVQDEDCVFDPENHVLRIRKAADVAQILDGQHRLAGLSASGKGFDLNIAVFVGLDLEDQSSVFATINLTQARVNKSLVYDLYSYAKLRSPQRTAHRVVIRLDQDAESALQGRVKRLGSAEGDSDRTVTQAVIVESLLRLMTPSAGKDRDRVIRGEKLSPGDHDAQRFPLWPVFVNQSDAELRDVIRSYFNEIADKWPDAWAATEGSILCRTSGIRATMRALGEHLRRNAGIAVTSDLMAQIVASYSVSDQTFSRDTYLPGSAGEGRLVGELTVNA